MWVNGRVPSVLSFRIFLPFGKGELRGIVLYRCNMYLLALYMLYSHDNPLLPPLTKGRKYNTARH